MWRSAALHRILSLIAAWAGRLHWNGSVLRRAQIASDLVLVDCPDHQLVKHVIAPGVELDRLLHRSILFLDRSSVRQNVHSELAALWIGFLPLQADGRDRRSLLALLQCELVIVAV